MTFMTHLLQLVQRLHHVDVVHVDSALCLPVLDTSLVLGVAQSHQEALQVVVVLWTTNNIYKHIYYTKFARDHYLKKGKFLYSTVSSPQDRSKHFTLYFPDRPVHSDTISASLGSIQPYATINARRLLVHISTTVYSQVLIYSAE